MVPREPITQMKMSERDKITLQPFSRHLHVALTPNVFLCPDIISCILSIFAFQILEYALCLGAVSITRLPKLLSTSVPTLEKLDTAISVTRNDFSLESKQFYLPKPKSNTTYLEILISFHTRHCNIVI